mmetsp:Transcript_47713/g.102245  ORF Transcript_47713/g.102245 Transcript_47713/m.102245 type:complete len:522 (+) Transcript_47713:39-1604(+)
MAGDRNDHEGLRTLVSIGLAGWRLKRQAPLSQTLPQEQRWFQLLWSASLLLVCGISVATALGLVWPALTAESSIDAMAMLEPPSLRGSRSRGPHGGSEQSNGMLRAGWQELTTSNFSVVIDAGSTGSRIHVFRFERDGRLVDVNGEAEVLRSTSPGVSSCAGAPGSVHRCIASLLGPLLDAAAAVVPPSKQHATPLAFRATAGLRMLPGSEADLLLEEVRSIIGGYSFLDAGVEVMSGVDEGIFEWVAVNTLLETLGPNRSSATVLDLGGASVQIADAVEPDSLAASNITQSADAVREVQVPGLHGTSLVHTHTFLGYGIMSARARIMEEAELANLSFENPCLLQGELVRYDHSGHHYDGQGTAEVAGCRQLIQRMLRSDSFSRAWSRRPSGVSTTNVGARPHLQPFAAGAFFFDALQSAGAAAAGETQMEVSPATYAALAAKACAEDSITTALAAYPWLSPVRVTWLCFDLTYLAELLTTGLGLSEGQQITAVKQISHRGRSFSATWALGVALDQIQKSS